MASDLELLAVAVRVAPGSGASVVLTPPFKSARVAVEVLDRSAGGGVIVAVETSPNESDWRSLGSIERISDESVSQRSFIGADAFVRVRWTLSGDAPSVTFGVVASPVQVYATPQAFARAGLPKRATADLKAPEICDALEKASRLIDDYLSAQVTLPLVAFANASIERATCVIAAYDLLSLRGFNPEQGTDFNVRERYKDILRWLERIQDGKAPLPGGIIDSGTDDDGGSPSVESDDLRGW